MQWTKVRVKNSQAGVGSGDWVGINVAFTNLQISTGKTLSVSVRHRVKFPDPPRTQQPGEPSPSSQTFPQQISHRLKIAAIRHCILALPGFCLHKRFLYEWEKETWRRHRRLSQGDWRASCRGGRPLHRRSVVDGSTARRLVLGHRDSLKHSNVWWMHLSETVLTSVLNIKRLISYYCLPIQSPSLSTVWRTGRSDRRDDLMDGLTNGRFFKRIFIICRYNGRVYRLSDGRKVSQTCYCLSIQRPSETTVWRTVCRAEGFQSCFAYSWFTDVP